MKAIYVSYQSPEDESSHAFVTFSNENLSLMEEILEKLKPYETVNTSFYIGEYEPPLHNPANFAEVAKKHGIEPLPLKEKAATTDPEVPW